MNTGTVFTKSFITSAFCCAKDVAIATILQSIQLPHGMNLSQNWPTPEY